MQTPRNLPGIFLAVLLLPTITCSWAAALLGEEGTGGPDAADGTVYASADQLIPWPLPMPSHEQVKEVSACRIGDRAAERYPESVDADELPDHYPVSTACDWAVLAAAYASRAEKSDSYSENGRLAWLNAVSRNAAYAFDIDIFLNYIEVPDAVAAPPFVREGLERIVMDYAWEGYGDEVAYRIEIENAHLSPEVTGTVDGDPFSAGLSVETAQALGGSLTGLLPVAKERKILVCEDNFPDWTVSLTYANGQTMELRTNGSNIYHYGGPWWATIGDQMYLQFSTTIIQAVDGIVDELGLPLGDPMGMYCYGLRGSMLVYLY